MPRHTYQLPNGDTIDLIIYADRETHAGRESSLFHLWRGFIAIDRGHGARTDIHRSISPSVDATNAFDQCYSVLASAGWKRVTPDPETAPPPRPNAA